MQLTPRDKKFLDWLEQFGAMCSRVKIRYIVLSP